MRRHTRIEQTITNITIWAGVMAGLLYSSWPLGFIFNPVVSHHDFASQLEASGQPYNWLFVSFDVIAGAILLMSGFVQCLKTPRQLLLRLSIIGYMLFGILVIAAAVSPDNCNTITQNCTIHDHQPSFVVHGLSSIFSVIFLLISMLLISRILIKRHAYRWLTLLGVLVLGGWGVLGIGTLYLLLHGMKSNWIQYLFISVCSLSIAISVLLIERLTPQKAPAKRYSR